MVDWKRKKYEFSHFQMIPFLTVYLDNIMMITNLQINDIHLNTEDMQIKKYHSFLIVSKF